MNRIQKAIAGLLRLDSIALAADGDNPDVAAAILFSNKLFFCRYLPALRTR